MRSILGLAGAIALAVTFVFTTGPVHAEVRQSLDWQRISYEEKLQERISRSIAAASVPAGSFVVSVTVEMKPGRNAKDSKDSKDTSKEKKVAPPPLSKEQIEAEATRVYLGKLETDAALIGSDDYIASDRGGTQALQEPGFFESVVQVRASVFIDKGVTDGKKTIIEAILKGAIGSVGAKPAEVKIEKVDLVPPPPIPATTEAWDAKRWAQEFKLPLGILLSTFCFGLLSLIGGSMIFNGFKKIESRKVSLLEAKDAREAATAEKAESAASGSFAVQGDISDRTHTQMEIRDGKERPAPIEIEGAQRGFDRFRALLRESPERGGLLVKQWLKSPGKGSNAALAALSQVLSGDELFSLFKQLSDNDRKEWKSVLVTVGAADSQLADAFVASQVVESMLVPPAEVDRELRQSLSELKLSECVELAQDDVEIGAILAVLMPTSQVAQMFALLPAEQVNDIALRSLRLSAADIEGKSAQIKRKLLQASGGRPVSTPFIERAAELLREVGAERESSIFSALAESGEYQLLEAAARRHFPAELVFKLPREFLKAALDRLPLSRRADLICSRESEEQEKLLQSVGAANSKSREMLEAEVQTIRGDEVRERRVIKGRDKLLSQFLDGVRVLISGNEAAVEMAEGALLNWLHEKSNGELGARQESQVSNVA